MPATPERQKSGRWKVRFRHGVSARTGRPRLTSETFDTKAEATRFARLVYAVGPQAALDQLDAEQQQAAVPSMSELAADHIEHLTGIEPGTRLTYSRLWARTWGPLVGAVPANQFTRDHAAVAVNALAERYSGKSLANQHGLLSAICERAVDKRYLHRNPVRGMRLPRHREESAQEMRVLTMEEFEGIYERMVDQYKPLVRFLAGTGARWGEAVALTVADVTLPNVRIRRAVKWTPSGPRTVGPTKTRKSKRTIQVPAKVAEDLAKLVVGRPGDALVFTAHKGGRINHRRFWTDYWLPAVKHLSPRPRIHDLRHSHASWLLAMGVPIHIVQARLGHDSIKTTVDTYSHLMPDAQAAAASAANAIFGSLRPPELD